MLFLGVTVIRGGLKMGRDNSKRYKEFSETYIFAYFDSSDYQQRKKNLDAEWTNKWMFNDNATEFKACLEELKSRREKTSNFNHTSRKKAKYDTGEAASSCSSSYLSKSTAAAPAPSVDLTSNSAETEAEPEKQTSKPHKKNSKS